MLYWVNPSSIFYAMGIRPITAQDPNRVTRNAPQASLIEAASVGLDARLTHDLAPARLFQLDEGCELGRC
jgi:hypothetical protein